MPRQLPHALRDLERPSIRSHRSATTSDDETGMSDTEREERGGTKKVKAEERGGRRRRKWGKHITRHRRKKDGVPRHQKVPIYIMRIYCMDS